MTDLTQLAPAAASQPAAAGAGALSTHHLQVNSALLTLENAVGAVIAAATGLEATPLNILPQTVSQVCAALTAVEAAAADVSATVSVALEAVSNTTTATPAAPPAATVAPGNAGFLHFTAPWIASNLYGVVPLAPLTAVPDHGEKWFAITRGKYVGLTTNSAISLTAVTGVPSGLSDKFTTQGEALQHFNEALGAQAVAILA